MNGWVRSLTGFLHIDSYRTTIRRISYSKQTRLSSSWCRTRGKFVISTTMRIIILLIAACIVSPSTEEDEQKKVMKTGPKGETDFVEKEYGVRYADTCEVCKYLVTELDAELVQTGKTHDVIETGYHIDTPPEKRKVKKYATSELRLIETLESVCNRLLEYRLHKERTDSTRFAKGTSQTFQVLNNLVAKGVKVDLGIPHELWDEPPAEVTNLKTQCEKMLESHESDIEEWYFQQTDKVPLMKYLCEERVLKNDPKQTKCLHENILDGEKGSKDEL